jgi:hypothetical protein
MVCRSLRRRQGRPRSKPPSSDITAPPAPRHLQTRQPCRWPARTTMNSRGDAWSSWVLLSTSWSLRSVGDPSPNSCSGGSQFSGSRVRTSLSTTKGFLLHSLQVAELRRLIGERLNGSVAAHCTARVSPTSGREMVLSCPAGPCTGNFQDTDHALFGVGRGRLSPATLPTTGRSSFGTGPGLLNLHRLLL